MRATKRATASRATLISSESVKTPKDLKKYREKNKRGER